MLSELEYNALVSVLQRAPLTQAEAVAVQMIMEKLKPVPQEPPKA